MTKLLEEAVAQFRTLPAQEQDRAAEILLPLVCGPYDHEFDAEQLVGIDHAIDEANRGTFASSERIKGIFNRDL